MDRYYIDLNESDKEPEDSVGDVFYIQSSNFYLVPFVHDGVQYLTYFTPVAKEQGGIVEYDTFKTVIESTTEGSHSVSGSPFVFKFGLKNNFDSSDVYGFDPEQKIGRILFTLPKKLSICLRKLMEKTGAEEFYFLPGSQCEKHQKKLDTWYSRFSNKLAEQHSLAPIHQDSEGGWYGYKRIS